MRKNYKICLIKTMEKIKEMSRWDTIQALRKYAHPSWFRFLLGFETAVLCALLMYYESGGDAKKLSWESND